MTQPSPAQPVLRIQPYGTETQPLIKSRGSGPSMEAMEEWEGGLLLASAEGGQRPAISHSFIVARPGAAFIHVVEEERSHNSLPG